MSQNRENPIGRYILAFLISTSLFILIFLFSYSVSFGVYQRTNSDVLLVKSYVTELNTFLGNMTCNEEILFEASKRLDFVGDQLSLLESRFDKQDLRILKQKEDYSELQFTHFKIVNELNKKCDEKFIIFFFFYSNIPSLKDKSERMGNILSTFKKENPERVMVYSFDADLNHSLIQEMKQNYNITKVPEVVINEEQTFILENINQLDFYLE